MVIFKFYKLKSTQFQVNCPICNNISSLKFKIAEFPILLCNACEHRFVGLTPGAGHVEKVYSDQYFFEGGAGYPDYTRQQDLLVRHGEYYAEKISKYMDAGSMIDIGAAAGFIMMGFKRRAWSVKGLEPNKTMVRYAREELGLNMVHGNLESFSDDEKYDLICLIQVIAHFYQLEDAFKNIDRMIKPEGRILVETWDSKSLTSRLFGKNWHEYSPPSTLHFFTRKSLDELLKRHGFVREAGGRPKKRIMGQHARELILHKTESSWWLSPIKWFAKLIPGKLILTYPAEDLFWALYRKDKKN